MTNNNKKVYLYLYFYIFVNILINGEFIYNDLTVPGSNNVYGSLATGCTYTIKFNGFDNISENIILVGGPPASSINVKSNSIYGTLTYQVPVGSVQLIAFEFRDSSSGVLLYTVQNTTYVYPQCQLQPYPLVNSGDTAFYTTGSDSTFSALTLKFSVATKYLSLSLTMSGNDKFQTCSGRFTSMTSYFVQCKIVVEALADVPGSLSTNTSFSITDDDGRYSILTFPTFFNSGPIPQIQQTLYPSNHLGPVYKWPMTFYQALEINGTNSALNYITSRESFTIDTSPAEPNLPSGASFIQSNRLYFAYGNENSKTMYSPCPVTSASGQQTFYTWVLNNLNVEPISTNTVFSVTGPVNTKFDFASSIGYMNSLKIAGNIFWPGKIIPPNFPYLVSFGDLNLVLYNQFPFGITMLISSAQPTFEYYIPFYLRSQYQTALVFFDNYNIRISQINITTGPIDNVAPTLEFVEYIDGSSALSKILRVHVKDNLSGVAKIIFGNGPNRPNLFELSSQDLAEGDKNDGVYERYFDAPNYFPSSTQDITIYDYNGNSMVITSDTQYFPINPYSSETPNTLVGNSAFEMLNFQFQKNNIDLSQNGVSNVLKFNFRGIMTNGYVSLGIALDSDSDEYTRFYGEYDSIQGCYVINFNLPSRLLNRDLDYFIHGAEFKLTNYDLRSFPNTTLSVYSDWADRFPPMILNVNGFVENDAGFTNLGWDFTIEDQWNGFKIGYVSVISSIDPFPRNFTIEPQPTNSIYLDTYSIRFSVPDSANGCVSQTFSISYISLTDTNGLTSDTVGQRYNPLMKILNNGDIATNAILCPTLPSVTPPTLTNITIGNNLPVNTAAQNIPIEIQFTIEDSLLPISTRNTPFCYLSISLLEKVSVQSELLGFTDSQNRSSNWRCKTNLPYGYGALGLNHSGTTLAVSVHGWANTGSAFGGIATELLEYESRVFSIPTVFNVYPFITSTTLTSLNNGYLRLDIFGRQLRMTPVTIKVTYGNGESTQVGLDYVSNLYARTLLIKANRGVSTITLSYLNSYVTPPYTINTGPETTTIPPIAQCQGTPQCGGPSNGECTSTGCQCKSPWMGPTCQSQIVIIDPPVIDPTSPTIDNNFNTTLPDGEVVSLEGLISIVQLNEYTHTDVKSYVYNFTKWTFTNLTSSNQTYQEYSYQTEILEKESNITVTVQYFTEADEILFAGQVLKMLPSTLKYKVLIDGYKFTSNLNYLELIMSASIESLSEQSDICSLSQFGPTSDPEQSSDFVKLQVREFSLYGRFIKYGLIDGNRVTEITNKIVDGDQLGFSSSNFKSQEFISMKLQHFQSNATMDPDFSVLIDTSPVDDSNPNAICGEKPSKGLTKAQLAGIIIGCVAFGVATIIVMISTFGTQGQFIYKDLTPEGINNIYGSNFRGCEYTINFFVYDASVIDIVLEETPPRDSSTIVPKENSLFGLMIFRAAIGLPINIQLDFKNYSTSGALLYTKSYSYPICELQPSPLENVGETAFYSSYDRHYSTIKLKFNLAKFPKVLFAMVNNDNYQKCSGKMISMTEYSVQCYIDASSTNAVGTFSGTTSFKLIDQDSRESPFTIPSFANIGPFPSDLTLSTLQYPNNSATNYKYPYKFYQSYTVTGEMDNIFHFLCSSDTFTLNNSPTEPNPTLSVSVQEPNGLFFAYGNSSSRTVMDIGSTNAAGTRRFYLWALSSLNVATEYLSPVMTIGLPSVSNIAFTPIIGTIGLENEQYIFITLTSTKPISNRYMIGFQQGALILNEFYQFPKMVTSSFPAGTAFKYTWSIVVPNFSITANLVDVTGGVIEAIQLPGTQDNTFPTLNFIEYLDGPDQFSKIIRMRIKDAESGVFKAEITHQSGLKVIATYVTVTSQDLIAGDLHDGIYEKYFEAPKWFPTYNNPVVNLFDYCGNLLRMYTTSEYFPEFPFESETMYTLVGNSNLTITQFEFLHQYNELSQNGSNNVLKFAFSGLTSVSSSYVSMGIAFDTITADVSTVEYTRFYGSYDTSEGCYIINFYLPPRLLSRDMDYFIQGYSFKLASYELLNIPNATLTVHSDFADRFPPMVVNVNQFASNLNGYITVGWNLAIEDQGNGFKEGFVSITSNIDPYPRNFTIKPIDGGNIYYDQYRVQFVLKESDCITQTFSISYLSLTDTAGLTSDTDGQKYNPFLKISNSYTTSVQATCLGSSSTTPPVLTNLTILNSLPIDIGAADIPIDILFQVTDASLPISDQHIPNCYLSALLLNKITIQAEFVNFTDGTKRSAFWKCSGQIPYGYGAIGVNQVGFSLELSVNGWANTGLAFGGATSHELVNNSLPHFIATMFNTVPIIQRVTLTPIGDGLLSMYIYGKQLAASPSLQIGYSDGGSEILGVEYASTFIIISLNVKENRGLSNITLSYGTFSTPPFTIDTGSLPTSTPEPTPTTGNPSTPTPTLYQCQGTPQCGGPSNGECTSTGCQCKSPWMGPTCQSQIVVIDPPVIDPTSPTIDNNFNTTLPDGEVISLEGLISIVQLNEYTHTDVKSYVYNFTKWTFTNLTSSNQTYQEYSYQTEISEKESNITVTVQYFTEADEILFAGQVLKMLPSTLKYKVLIDGYKFTSNLNYLELIMSASIESLSEQSDICSLSQFGQTSDPEQSSDFVKLQVREFSLYGRFIKYGLIDGNRVTEITNKIVDGDQLGFSSSNFKSQEFISMKLQHFQSNATMDPDFSVLIDTSPVDDSNPNAICGEKPTKGLTKAQLAGIIIGSIGFATIAIISVSYVFYKKRKDRLFVKNINQKLSSHEKL
ncbi:EGF-like domain-containing protein [Tieghemostelium lacteum]|uniref:EGF-like domain-containing protein n=1 Tax=Tieghemostelium lacteum TaxID=361077 RepID=A0A152A1V7_TIELA|nr:EGF-like domain-containing protein [Tieghemostelium lacteum]|eukprot:KYR00200.1 EGF-like domain-containing protein [Tieghemostelium lacteum]